MKFNHFRNVEHIKVQCKFNQAKEAKQSSYYAMKLTEPKIDGEEAKSYFFRFVDEKRMLEDSTRVQLLLRDKNPNEVEQQINFLGPEALSKLALLQENTPLKDQFSKLVVSNPNDEQEQLE